MMVSGFLLFSGNALGAGFAIVEQSASGAGYAYAGAAAAARDASTIFFNPAGMALQSGNELQVGAHYIMPQADFKNQGSSIILGAPLTGGNGGDGGDAALVPNLYYMYRLSDQWKAGIGVTAPYGLVTEYDQDWVGRYYALTADGVPGFTPQGMDGNAKIEGDDWGVGANVGLIFEPLTGTRLGLHYRSKIDHTLEGDATFNTPAAVLATGVPQASGRVDTSVKADVSLPETVSLSVYHAVNPRWALLADVTWTKWSRLEELRIKYGNGAADSVDTLDWDDTWRYSLGAIFNATEPLELRAGVALDESPIPNEQRRTPRIPGADRIWLTMGAGYQFTARITADFAYAHLFVDDPGIDKDVTELENQLRGVLVGEYDASVDIISASVSFRF